MSVGECWDEEIDIMDKCFNRDGRSEFGKAVYNYIVKEYGLITARAKTMFERILMSEMQSRDLVTFSGKFMPRKAATILMKPNNPRVYRQTTTHEDVGFDISILLDMSGSMSALHGVRHEGGDTVRYRADSTFAKVYPVMVTLAHSLTGISGVNLEILGFSADLKINKRGNDFSTSHDNGANNIYVIKPFDALNLDERLTRLTGISENGSLFCQNFDIGALKVAASRLARYSLVTGNKKLLIVLSDGNPCSSHTSSNAATKKVITELESQLNIYGIGLGSHSVEALYKNSIVVANLSHDLLEVIISRLSRFVMTGK